VKHPVLASAGSHAQQLMRIEASAAQWTPDLRQTEPTRVTEHGRETPPVSQAAHETTAAHGSDAAVWASGPWVALK